LYVVKFPTLLRHHHVGDQYKDVTIPLHKHVEDQFDLPTRFIHNNPTSRSPHPPRPTLTMKSKQVSTSTNPRRHSPNPTSHQEQTRLHTRHTTIVHRTRRPTRRQSKTRHLTTMEHKRTTAVHENTAHHHHTPTRAIRHQGTTHHTMNFLPTKRHTTHMITHHRTSPHLKHPPHTTKHSKKISTKRVHPPTKNHQPTFNMAAILKSIKEIVQPKIKRDNRPKPSPTPNINSLRVPTPYVLPLHDPTKIRILCFGDSLTAGYYHHGKSFFPYCNPLKQILSARTHLPVIGDAKGIVGEMTHKQMTNRLPLVLGNATTQYDWIIILGGTNDILHVKNFADDQEFLNQLENVWQPRITKDIEKLHSISYKYGAHTLLLTVPENAIEVWPEYKPLMKMRNKINNSLKRFAYSSNGQTVFCDIARKVPRHSLSPAQENALWDDHLHMTPEGYTKMARVISDCLEPYLPHRKFG